MLYCQMIVYGSWWQYAACQTLLAVNWMFNACRVQAGYYPNNTLGNFYQNDVCASAIGADCALVARMASFDWLGYFELLYFIMANVQIVGYDGYTLLS